MWMIIVVTVIFSGLFVLYALHRYKIDMKKEKEYEAMEKSIKEKTSNLRCEILKLRDKQQKILNQFPTTLDYGEQSISLAESKSGMKSEDKNFYYGIHKM